MTQSIVEKMLLEIQGHLYHGRRALSMMPIQKFKGLRTLLLAVGSEAEALSILVNAQVHSLDSSEKVK